MKNQAGRDMVALAAAQIEAEFAVAVRDWLEGRSDELPEPSLYGLSDEDGCRLAADTSAIVLAEDASDESALEAFWYDEASAAYEQILRVA